ncbi:hypothetical protein F4778DRAFT_757770 [Xylariomycetidae sp. FL2044]|nr:hypothetical protein F4778DRAFT_757770 [Xylariomycetidae sp. FL2044]
MSPRTNFAQQSIFERPAPSAVTYDLSVPDQAVIKLLPGSTWTSGAHWHEKHTEFLQVLSGHAEISLSGTILPAVCPGDGVVTVPRGSIHEWRRSRSRGLEEELVVKEWTDPKDGEKEVFFRNINGIVLDAFREGDGSWRMRTLDLELMSLFWKMDNWPVFLNMSWPGWAQNLVTKTVIAGSVLFGRLVGCKGVHDEYAPTRAKAQ